MLTHMLSPRVNGPVDGAVVPPELAFPTRALEPNDVLYRADDEATLLYTVEAGVLKGIVPTAVGRERIIDLYGHGEVLGSAALYGGRHPETVIAVQPSSLIPFDARHAMQDPTLARYVARGLARQLRRSREAIDDAELPVGARLGRLLLRLTRRFGLPADAEDGFKLPLNLTHEDFALMTGSSRVTITRVLSDLRQAGAVSGTRGVYVIRPERLEGEIDHYVLSVL